jgi:osmotically-inducible protein OsmY
MRSDSEVRQDVLDELQEEPSVNANKIGVTVDHGIVTLSGYACSHREKRAAEQAAGRVKGVKAIAEEIVVKSPESSACCDADIALAVVNALQKKTSISEPIEVKVEQGVVTLNGDVRWKFEREVAREAIVDLPGVREIVNVISVLEQPASISGQE